MNQSEADFGNLIQTCFPKRSKFAFDFLLPAVLLVLAYVFGRLSSQVPSTNPFADPFAKVKTTFFIAAMLFMIISAVFLACHHIESMIRGRLDFYENGIIFRTMYGVISIPSKDVQSIEPMRNASGKYYCLTLIDGEKVLISSQYFGPEIKDYLYAYLPKAE